MELCCLWKGESAQVLLSSWDRSRHPADREGRTRWAVIEFIRSGGYARHGYGRDLLVDANHVAFFNPAESFLVSHPCGDQNTGLTLRLSPDLLRRALADIGCRTLECAIGPFRAPCALTSSRCHLLQDVLVRYLRDHGAAEPVSVEELLLSLVREAASGSCGPRRTAEDRSPGRAHRSGRERIEIVRRFLLLNWAERLTLAEIAGVVGWSCWHLAARFRTEVGLPLHRYLKRLRLRHALERLHAGCTDLTRLAFDCGFSSHSHFTAAFRQEFGTTPHVLRSGRSSPTIDFESRTCRWNVDLPEPKPQECTSGRRPWRTSHRN
jgi:AraC-like DNA-binding protein